MKVVALFIFTFLGIIASATADPDAKVDAECARVDGPANIRESAGGSGKIVRSIPAGSVVEVYKLESQDWWKVQYFWNGKTATCSDEEDNVFNWEKRIQTGFIHRKNILKGTFVDVFAIDPCGKGGPQTNDVGRQELTGTLITDCKCSVFTNRFDYDGCKNTIISKGKILGRDCRIENGTISCSVRNCMAKELGSSCKETQCPASCVRTEKSKRMTEALKRAAFENEVPKAHARVIDKLGKNVGESLTRKYPAWVPLIIPSKVEDPNFEYEPVLSASVYRGPMVLGSATQEVVFAIFFETIELALKESARWIIFDLKGNEIKTGTIPSIANPEKPVEFCLIPVTPGPFKTSILYVFDPNKEDMSLGYCPENSGIALIDFHRFDRPLEPVKLFGGKARHKNKTLPSLQSELDDKLSLESKTWFERTGLKSCNQQMVASACAPLVGGN